MIEAELREQALRPFDRACHELWEEHHVQCVDSEVSLRALIPSVDLDRIAHCLESMKGQTDRKQNGEARNCVGPPKEGEHSTDIPVNEVEIFEKGQNSHVRTYTCDEPKPSSSIAGGVDENCGTIVYSDHRDENEDRSG